MHGDNLKSPHLCKWALRPKDVVDTRRALAWKEVEGKMKVRARLVATGHRDPDLRDGNVDVAGCAS